MMQDDARWDGCGSCVRPLNELKYFVSCLCEFNSAFDLEDWNSDWCGIIESCQKLACFFTAGPNPLHWNTKTQFNEINYKLIEIRWKIEIIYSFQWNSFPILVIWGVFSNNLGRIDEMLWKKLESFFPCFVGCVLCAYARQTSNTSVNGDYLQFVR